MAMVLREESAALAVADVTEGMNFDQMVAMGDRLVKTGFLPEHLKTGAQVAAVILTGRELGMSPMRAIRSLNLVKGKVTENADSQLARFKSVGGRAKFLVFNDDTAELWLRHPNGDEHTERFTMADAERAGLLNAQPNYRKYPRAMLRSRAITAGLKSVGWEGASGTYDPDELRYTDAPAPSYVPAPSHYEAEPVEPTPSPAPGFAEALSEATSIDALNAIGKRIKAATEAGALSDEERTALSGLYKQRSQALRTEAA